METLFVLLFGMLVAGAGIALGIVAYDKSRDGQAAAARCSVDE